MTFTCSYYGKLDCLLNSRPSLAYNTKQTSHLAISILVSISHVIAFFYDCVIGVDAFHLLESLAYCSVVSVNISNDTGNNTEPQYAVCLQEIALL